MKGFEKLSQQFHNNRERKLRTHHRHSGRTIVACGTRRAHRDARDAVRPREAGVVPSQTGGVAKLGGRAQSLCDGVGAIRASQARIAALHRSARRAVCESENKKPTALSCRMNGSRFMRLFCDVHWPDAQTPVTSRRKVEMQKLPPGQITLVAGVVQM